MSDLLRVGVSGLVASQTALRTTGHNITNAGVDGYSRQTVEFGSNTASFSGGGYVGSGVSVQTVQRQVEAFLGNRLSTDASNFNGLDVIRSNIEQVDSLLADASTGLSGGFERFFDAMAAAADDPASIPVRQLVISEAQGMVERFQNLYDRFTQQNQVINQQMASVTDEISTIATGVADLNRAIAEAVAKSQGNPPNDLLDERDRLIQQLSEKVSVNVTSQSNGMTNVFIGKGQPLVVGIDASGVTVKRNSQDPNIYDIELTNRNGQTSRITDSIAGGTLGGLLSFREEVLDPTLNQIGRLSLVIADTVNQQHALGVDLEGNPGGLVFADVNTDSVAYQRVRIDGNNSPPQNSVVRADLRDSSELTTSDYLLTFDGTSNNEFSVRRLSDGRTVGGGTTTAGFPVSVEFDGLEVTLEKGSFFLGDKFLISPTRHAASSLEAVIERPEELAFSTPISTEASLGNLGSGQISMGEMLARNGQLDIGLQSFDDDGSLNPPLLIRFTSATTYDVLDNSDPANPKPMDPPLRNLTYTPGGNNPIFSEDVGATLVQGDQAITQQVFVGLGNGYGAETVTILNQNPDNGLPGSQVIDFNVGGAPGVSARSMADQLSSLEGVTARANTEATLSINDNDSSTFLSLTLNGVQLSSQNSAQPLSADALRDVINQDGDLQRQGIIAISNGSTLTLRSTRGDDLQFSVNALNASGLPVASADGITITQVNGTAASHNVVAGDNATVGGVLDVELASDLELRSTGGMFSGGSIGVPLYRGYQASLSGVPQAGDEFSIHNNDNGVSDNRNALALSALQTSALVGGTQSYGESYAELVEGVGNQTNQIRIKTDAAEALWQQSKDERDALSGVNLDEEAARLIEFEQAYSASAQVISVARQLFDTLINAFR